MLSLTGVLVVVVGGGLGRLVVTAEELPLAGRTRLGRRISAAQSRVQCHCADWRAVPMQVVLSGQLQIFNTGSKMRVPGQLCRTHQS